MMERDRRFGWGQEQGRRDRDEDSEGYGAGRQESYPERGSYAGSRDQSWRGRSDQYGYDSEWNRGNLRSDADRDYGRGMRSGERDFDRHRDFDRYDSASSSRNASYGSYGAGSYGGAYGGSYGGYGNERYGTSADRFGGDRSSRGGYGSESDYGDRYTTDRDTYGAYGTGWQGHQGGYGGSQGWGRDLRGREWNRSFDADRQRSFDGSDRDEGGFFHRMGERVGEGLRNMRGMMGGDRERGPFFGKGPKGYRRSDERIREEVSECIARQGWIDATEVEIRVQNGEVTLTGTVREREHRRRLEQMIEELPGVDEIKNELRVKREERTGAAASSTGAYAGTESNNEGSPRGTSRNARTS